MTNDTPAFRLSFSRVGILALWLVAGLLAGAKEVPMTTGEDIGCFFPNPGEVRTLVFQAGKLAEGRELVYEIADYSGQPTGQTGRATVRDKALAVTETFPAGYFEVRFPELELVFGVASLSSFAGEADPFYAIEGLISSRPEQRRRQLVELLVRYGIRSNREWCNYPGLEPVRGTISTSRDEFYTLAGEAGFRSIFCFADFPSWYYDGGKIIGRRPPPRRLLGLDESIATLLERRRAGLMAFHVLNEYDIYDIPGEAYLPTIKVAGYAMAGNDLPLVGAPFCRGTGAESSVRSSIANGLLDYVDAFSFHTYSSPESMVNLIGIYRDMMAGHRKAGMPLWITESGKPWSRGLPPAEVTETYGGPLGSLHPSPGEDMKSALWITMKAVEAKAAGVEKYFAFTLPFFQENNNNFGMMDYHFTPLRSLAAYLHSVRELAGKEYLGDWRDKPENVTILRVFGNSDRTELTAVLYTGSEDACTVDPAGLPWRSARSIDGRELTGTPLTFVGGMAYATLDPEAVSATALDTETKAMALLRQAREYQPVQRVHSPIVYQFDHWSFPQNSRDHYRDESNQFRVNVFNFSREAVAIAPRLVLPEGMRIVAAPAQTEQILEPRSEIALTWKLDPTACPLARYDIRLTDANHPYSGVCVPFLDYSGLRAETFDFMNSTRWRHNSSGKSTFEFDEAEQAVKVSTVFDFEMGTPESKGRDYWVFPEYILELPRESLVGAQAISLELKFRQGNGATAVKAPLVMFAYQDANEKGKYDSVAYGTPTGEWQKFVVPIDGAKTELYKMIRIGMCPTAPQIDYWMRNITLYYAR